MGSEQQQSNVVERSGNVYVRTRRWRSERNIVPPSIELFGGAAGELFGTLSDNVFDSVVTDDFLDQVFDAGLAGSASTDLFDGIEPNDSEQFDSEQFGSALDDVPRAVAKVDVTTMNSNNI